LGRAGVKASKRIRGGTSDAPTWFFRRNPPLRWPRIQPWGFPRPRPNLPLGLPHSGGVLVCETSPPKSFRCSNGGDLTEGLTRNRWEEVNDERCSDRRKRGHFGFNRLGGLGECTSQYQSQYLSTHPGGARGTAAVVGVARRSRAE